MDIKQALEWAEGMMIEPLTHSEKTMRTLAAEVRRLRSRLKAAEDVVEACNILSLVIGLTPLAGNKEACQEAYNLARAALDKYEGRE